MWATTVRRGGLYEGLIETQTPMRTKLTFPQARSHRSVAVLGPVKVWPGNVEYVGRTDWCGGPDDSKLAYCSGYFRIPDDPTRLRLGLFLCGRRLFGV